MSVYCHRCKDRRECGADPKRFADCNDRPQPVEDVFVTLTRAACPAHESYTCVLHETCTADGPNVCPWFCRVCGGTQHEPAGVMCQDEAGARYSETCRDPFHAGRR